MTRDSLRLSTRNGGLVNAPFTCCLLGTELEIHTPRASFGLVGVELGRSLFSQGLLLPRVVHKGGVSLHIGPQVIHRGRFGGDRGPVYVGSHDAWRALRGAAVPAPTTRFGACARGGAVLSVPGVRVGLTAVSEE